MIKRVISQSRKSYSFRFSLILCLLLFFPLEVIHGETEREGDDDPAAAQVDQDQELLEYILSDDYQPLRSILLDQEAPLLGLRWGSTIIFDVPLNDEPEGAETTLRLARLSYRKSFNDDWTVKFMVNYNNAGDFELGNNFAIYTGWKTATAKLGVFDPAFSLEKVSARAGTTFMERALPVEALSERRSGGFGLLKRTPNAFLNGGIFLFSPDYQGQSQSGQAVVFRYVHSPLERNQKDAREAERSIWTGISLSYRVNASGPDTQFRSRPELAISDDYFVDTGPIAGADKIFRMGFEASKVTGPISWQTELLGARVDRGGRPTTQFWGAYIFASWFITGESRNYSALSARFVNTRPISPIGKNGWGAFELAARASIVDLNDKDIIGGKQTNVSLGLNWYLNEQWRLMADLVKVLDVDRPGSSYDGLDPLILALRAQWFLP
jgi:phosphate-selective porin OprO/OprP